jgi:cell division protease FtsH
MDFKRIFRGPWLWIVLGVVAVISILSVINGNAAGEQVDTSEAVAAIRDGSAETVLFVDGDQEVQIVMDDGSEIRAQWVTEQGIDLVDMVETQISADPPQIDSYSVDAPTEPSLLGSILGALFPIIIIVLLFVWLLSQVQGGGGRVMQFGKSKARLITKDMPKTTFADVAGAQEAVEELEEIKEFLAEPAKFQAVGAKIPKGVLLYGQPGTARPCSRGRSPARQAFRSTPSPVPTSWRCSSVSAPAGCATCSSRPRRTRPLSSSSTRSTPSGGTVAPAWAVAR